MFAQLELGLVPQLAVYDRLVLARVTKTLVTDFTEVDRMREQLVERTARESVPTRPPTTVGDPNFRLDAAAIERFLQSSDATEFPVAVEDISHGRRFGRGDHQPALAHVVAERSQAAHPDALALGGGDLVADALARHLAFEL